MNEVKIIDALLDKYDGELKKAFLDTVYRIRGEVTLADVIKALEAGDIESAIAAMRIEADAWQALEMSLAEAFAAGGQTIIDAPRPRGVVLRWSVRNSEAEAWLRDYSSRMITRIVEDQIAAVRSALVGGLAAGDNPRRTALDIVGRISRATGKREGGIIGLSRKDEIAVSNARLNLMNGEWRSYMKRERRDKRYDSAVAKAAKSGQPIPRDKIDDMVKSYANRLLITRGENIARLETATAINVARDDAIRAQIRAGRIEEGDVGKTWSAIRDEHTRYTHREMNGQTVPLDGFFHSPSGEMLRYPCDPQASLAERSGCRCRLKYKIDFFAALERRRAAA